MSQINIGETTLNFKDSAFTGDQWEQVASWVLNGGGESAAASAQIATDKALEAVKSAASANKDANSAKSYAVGGTGTRDGEDTDNAKFYCQQAHAIAGEGMVFSVNGQQADETGNVEIDTGVKTVNGVAPDENGNVEVDAGGVKTINSKAPDENGNVEITPDGIGAAKSTHASSHASGGSDPLTAADIGAAPAGYGLGKEVGKKITIPSVDQLDTILDSLVENGWYSVYRGADVVAGAMSLGGVAFNYISVEVSSFDGNYKWQTVRYVSRTGTLKRCLAGGTWSEWEWDTPPMNVGVEYRTTERYNGKPVYVKLHRGIALPSNADKGVAALASDCRIIEIHGFNVDTGAYFPSNHFNGNSGQKVEISPRLSTTMGFIITTNFDASAYTNNQVITKHWKTTD